MSGLITRLAGWWASKAASNWLIAALAAVVVSGVWYIKDLQVKAAACETATETVERYERLADRLALELEKDRDDRIESIAGAQHECLDRTIDSLLNDDEVEGG